MAQMIGYCGYHCHLCAARSDDPAVRQKLVDGWRKIFGHQNYTAENVRCDGCPSDGKVADQQCQARPCAKQKGVESCAWCDEFPCEKMRHLMATREGMLIWSHRAASSIAEEEYNLCMRQFDSMPNLLRALVSAGKLPEWVIAESTGEG
jgi:Zn-finger protein